MPAHLKTDLLTPTGVHIAPALPAHIPALDGLRGLAVIAVMFFHFAFAPADLNALGHAFVRVTKIGWVGVDLFFVLSGFLITGILLDAKETPHFFKNFYMRRTLRIFPLYYLALALFILFAPRIPLYDPADVRKAIDHQPWYWLYASNILMTIKSDWICHQINHFWSLAVEEHFYLIWPAIVYFLPRRRLAALCVFLLVACLAARIILVASGASHFAPHILTPCRMDTLAVGGLLAILARSRNGLTALINPAKWLLVLSSLAVLAILLVRRELKAEDPWMLTAGFSILAVLFASLVTLAIAANQRSLGGLVLNNITLRFFGKYSYALYIFHRLLEPFLRKYINPMKIGGTTGLLIHIAAGFAASVALALLSWHLFEKHFLKLKKFFEYRRTENPKHEIRITNQ